MTSTRLSLWRGDNVVIPICHCRLSTTSTVRRGFDRSNLDLPPGVRSVDRSMMQNAKWKMECLQKTPSEWMQHLILKNNRKKTFSEELYLKMIQNSVINPLEPTLTYFSAKSFFFSCHLFFSNFKVALSNWVFTKQVHIMYDDKIQNTDLSDLWSTQYWSFSPCWSPFSSFNKLHLSSFIFKAVYPANLPKPVGMT